MDPSAEMTIGSTRLTSCQLTTKWRGSCFFPLAAAESWGLMPVGADGPGLPTSGKGCSVLIGQAWVTCLPTVTPSVKMRSVHRVHQKNGPAQTADPPIESHVTQCPHPPRAIFSLPVLRWISGFPLQMVSSLANSLHCL